MLPILWLTLWLAGLQARPVSSLASIDGVVVRAGAAAAGAPEQVADARVELKPGYIVVFTDAGGAFRFRGLQPGRYTISVTHNGLIPQEDRRITLAADQTLKNFVVSMVPSPVISGQIFDPHGEPLAATLVRAYQRRYTPYGTQLKIVRKAMTSDLGEFRLSDLGFGEYFVSAAYSDRDRTAAAGKIQLSANVSPADDGYATVFYDGGQEISQARPVHLNPDSDPGALGLYFREPPHFKIRGQVVPMAPSPTIFFAPKGSDLADADYTIQPNANGAFEVRGVSPGSYLFLATADNGRYQSEVVSINVTDNDIEGVRLTLVETEGVSGTLLLSAGSVTDLSRLHVKLVASDTEFDQTIDARMSPDGTFFLEHVGVFQEYDFVVAPLPPGMYVRSIISAKGDLLPGKMRIPADRPLRITLADATEALGVHVTKRSGPAAGAKVVLIPTLQMRRRADRYVTGVTDESGDLHLTAIPPGTYAAYAFEKIDPDGHYALAYNPGAENRFKSRSVPVIADPTPMIAGQNAAKKIQLELIPAEETAGGMQ